MARVLVLGTRNKKKLGELVDLLAPALAPWGVTLKTLADFPDAIDVEETGVTFQENATLKAVVQAKRIGRWVLGEDSGLSVDALDGRPGVWSARYSDPGATDERNNDKLLTELKDVPRERRGAHYTCHATIANPQGDVLADVEGECHGVIRTERHGDGGFGYDPMFEVVEHQRTFGQLPAEIKAQISHRAQAMRLLIPEIERVVSLGQWPDS